MPTALTPTEQMAMDLASGSESHGRTQNSLKTLSVLEETKLTELLEDHRLGPLVEYNLRSGDSLKCCSKGLQEFLEKKRKFWTNQARIHRLVLVQVCNILESAGIPAVALKGSYLAWHVYNHPSHRPLRDLDILVPEVSIADGSKLLQSMGCEIISDAISPGDPIDWASYDVKFLHPLGVVIELHRALWYFAVEGGVEDFSLRPDFWMQDSPYFCWVEGIRYLTESYRYLHILVHHIYKHHLGVGPLGLHDLRLLVNSPSLNCTEVTGELITIGAPSLDRVARTLINVYNGADADDALVQWLPLIFLTPKQNQFIYRTRRSIFRHVLMWLKIQWLDGHWSTTPVKHSNLIDGILKIVRKAPAMALRPGLQLQIRERMEKLLRKPQDGNPEILNTTMVTAANNLRQAITKA